MPLINWTAVYVSTAVAVVLGGLWYGPLFSRIWMREMGVGRDFRPRLPRPVLLGMSIAFSFIAAVGFGAFVGPAPSALMAIGGGLVVGCVWIAPALITIYLFAARSLTLALVDAGFPVAQFLLYGVVFTLIDW